MSITSFPDLKEYAINYLAKYSSSEKNLVRILRNKIKRWENNAQKEGLSEEEIADTLIKAEAIIPTVILSMKKLGALNDAQFAERRTYALLRSGNSLSKIKAKLLGKGIDFSVVDKVNVFYKEQNSDELAILVFAKKRKVGPFRKSDSLHKKDKEILILSRAGFAYQLIKSLMEMDTTQAQERINELQAYLL